MKTKLTDYFQKDNSVSGLLTKKQGAPHSDSLAALAYHCSDETVNLMEINLKSKIKHDESKNKIHL